MKKSVIKRRKRVIPTTQEGQGDDYSSSGEQGVSPPPDGPTSQPDTQPKEDVDMERGTVNSDGSVNLGLRRRADHALSLVPETALRQGQGQSHQQQHPQHQQHQQHQQQPSPRLPGASDLNQYHSSSSSSSHMHQHSRHSSSHLPSIMNEDNRLPPLTNLPSMATIERQTSLSPASFLSPSRKRSFSSSENDYSGPAPPSSHGDGMSAYSSGNVGGSNNVAPNTSDPSSKRMSSIKSILNAPGDDNDDDLGSMAGPYPGIGGGSMSQQIGNDQHGSSSSGGGGVGVGVGGNMGQARDEKRAALQREAERMRQMLAAKERELAELD